MNIEIMNNNYTIDLTLMPTTLDLWHVYLLATVLLLALIIILLLLSMLISLGRKLRKPVEVVKEPEVKIVEVDKVVEVEKIVEVEKVVEVEKIVQAPPPEPVILKEFTPDAALQLLGALQKEARFIDFIKEDITSYDDADVGIAARVVHEGFNKAINEYFTIEEVRSEQEGSKLTLGENFDNNEVRLTGNIVGHAPFNGTLVHKGWQVTDIRLPKLTEGHNANIVAPAEVEI